MELFPTKQYTSEHPRIDPTEKEFWIAWLLSEKYKDKQGYEALYTTTRSGVGFCCLGVYCEEKKVPKSIVTATNIWYGNPGNDSKGYIPQGYQIPWDEGDEDIKYAYGSGFDGNSVIFELVEQGLDGLPVSNYPKPFTVATLNDSRQFTFAQMADVIRYFL